MPDFRQFVTLTVNAFGFFVFPLPGEYYRLADPPDLYRFYSISANILGLSGVLVYLGILYEISAVLPANF